MFVGVTVCVFDLKAVGGVILDWSAQLSNNLVLAGFLLMQVFFPPCI